MPLAPVETSQETLAERSTQQVVGHQHDLLRSQPLLAELIEAMPGMVAILNPQRQIALANSALLERLEVDEMAHVLGRRPGEAMDCSNACLSPQGCGTAEECRHCGALRAILEAQQDRIASHDCSISGTRRLEPLELRVKASPLSVLGQQFTVLALRDISQERRLRMLERTFFHDILNTAGGVQGMAMLVDDAEDMDEVGEFAPLLSQQAEQMVAAIEAQRDMLAAERGELEVVHLPVGSLTVVQGAVDLFSSHQVAEGKTIRKDPASERLVIKTGKALLQRTLGNMLKNALEASQPGDVVTIGCRTAGAAVRFHVHNSAVMPPAVQDRVFKRSFTTKGEGRGIGTYSMKLLGEKYLGGRVGFTSNPSEGTIFWIELPL
jgi:signal transduction histidine kinase